VSRRAEDYPGLDLDRTERTYMEALERRGGWLERRIAKYHSQTGNPSRDLMELKALQWALDIVRASRKVET
jgi:hypothetical protein